MTALCSCTDALLLCDDMCLIACVCVYREEEDVTNSHFADTLFHKPISLLEQDDSGRWCDMRWCLSVVQSVAYADRNEYCDACDSTTVC